MKKKIVITTEKREIWVVREAEAVPQPDQPIDDGEAIVFPSRENTSQQPDDVEKKNNG